MFLTYHFDFDSLCKTWSAATTGKAFFCHVRYNKLGFITWINAIYNRRQVLIFPLNATYKSTIFDFTINIFVFIDLKNDFAAVG